jgi:hypothetical protein
MDPSRTFRPGVAVGGPWVEGMEDSGELYLKVNGLAKLTQISSPEFGEVEKENLKAGAMTVAIRNVTMPPGSRLVKTDHFPPCEWSKMAN